jgi:transposase
MPPVRRTAQQDEQYDAPSQHPNVTQRSRRCQLAPYERVKLVELKAIGWSYNEIHERYPHIPVGTIKTTIARSPQRGPTQETLSRSGPPKKLDEEDKAKLLRAIEENPRIKYDGLLALIDFRVQRQTIWRLLREENKRKWLVLQRPELTEDQARVRRVWAERVRDYNSNKWRRVFWSDESTVERGKGARREYTFTRPACQIAARDIEEISVHKGIKQMFWAAFSGSGR